MKCQFQVGQKVVMVEAFQPHVHQRAADEGVTLPTVGLVYTIRDMEPGVFLPSKIFIWLEELRNGPCDDGVEANWDSTMFRAVVEPKTDISIFKAMLNPSRVEEVA